MISDEEYFQQQTLAALMTGSITGLIKYSDLTNKEKKNLAKQLVWCYETAKVEMSVELTKEIQELLSI